MFDQLFKRTAAIGRHTKAPLYAERVRYLAHLASLGSTRQTLRDKAWDLLHIQAAMQLRSPTAVTMSRIEKAVDRWVKQRRCRRPGALYECKRQALISLGVRWLKFLGWLECDVRKDPNAAKIEAFQSYMRDERCLSPVTIHTQLCRATEFLGLISFFGRRLGSVDIETIDNILRLKSSRDGLTRVSIQRYVSDVRNFLRYAEMQNWCRKGLADALPPCRTYKNEALPASPSLESVNRLIAQTDAQRPCDLRNRAILLLLALYGLRSSEVRRICLEDVDWDHRVLLIRRTKPSQEVQAYPLVPSVAESIADYLKRGRPQTKQRVIFLHARAPFYEQEVVKAFHKLADESSARSFYRAEACSRGQGQAKPGASGPLTPRRVQYAGEYWRARVIGLASMQAHSGHMFTAVNISRNPVYVPWSEAGHRARQT
ncbi:site-specific integrase [Paraburkholderia sediminicola]|nr:site-specific integrase [Paraburkholderia sediminicola]